MNACCLSLIATLLLAGAPESHVYTSQDGQTKLSFGSIKSRQLTNGDWSLDIRGGVTAISKQQGLDVRSNSATCLLHNKGNETKVQKLHALGNVVMVKSVGGKKTTIHGSSADYTAGGSEDVVDLQGPVHLVDLGPAGASMFDATGTSGHVVMAASSKGQSNPVRSALLHGPVTLKVRQKGRNGGAPTQAVATGRELLYEHQGSPKVTLRGGVVLKGLSGAFGGTLQAGVVILTLNDKNEVTNIESPESGG